ncbi:kinesin-like protein KIN-13B [Beta vulgaris subsp. vulgaris]|uniref:kinesin-like protein KIN-13B n=1 Tax=Beta vulgaris subsp. vulgaris TaxID=3555 RepID=UPI0025469C6C|nr:kinesin-like protein KIN-13B [Beta vulgaris subsp. vulgaris]
MNVVGRQMQRGATRQVSDSNDFIEVPSKWLQSANLPQDYGLYGAEGGSKWSRNPQRGLTSGNEFPLDPPSPLNSSRVPSLSPGLLDLHAFDTELIPEMPIHNAFDGPPLNQPARSKSLEESDIYLAANKNASRANSVAKIKVVVRKRPLNRKEMAKKEDDIITIERNSNALTVHETKFKVDLTEYVEKHEFMFDAVFGEDVPNDEVYAETVEPVVPLIFQKTKATCFAYGQTGNGKTYTMQPLPLRASQDILRLIRNSYRNQGFQLFVSFFEIYGGKLYDLLNDRKSLCMREDGKKQVCIVGLQEYKVCDAETIKDLIVKGNASRSTGTTGANEESSRSHAILQLVIKRSVDSSDSKPPRAVGKLSFIDLAGSERGADTTDNDKQTRMEGAEINKSLLALKECIRALDNDQNHIPFRGSKLTEVLRDSFVGNSRTIMISCVSPNWGSCEHTLNTLRYADRVKSLSKGNNSRRDLPSSTAPKDSNSQLLSSGSAHISNLEDTDGLSGSGRFGWSREPEREASPSPKIERVPSGRADNTFVSGYSDHYRGQKGSLTDMSMDDYDNTEEVFEQEKSYRMKNKKAETYHVQAAENRTRKDLTDVSSNNRSSDDDLNALLKEEEDLVASHRGLIEETMELVREEMNLLIDAEQPGNHLDDYVSRLNSILSQKAAGILKLQSQLANFKQRLNEHNVLVSAARY